MELINGTRMAAACTMGMDPGGREFLVVVVKGTFRIPRNGEQVRLDETQLPLIMADTFTGPPGQSAPVYEADFALRKRRCDVLLLGSAYAPEGRPATRVPVGLRAGKLVKGFAVTGRRHWEAGVTGIGATPPEPFLSQPISYDVAFGGVDLEHDDPAQHAAFLPNPVGRGFCKHVRSEWVDGKPLPSTEQLNRPVTRPGEPFLPMAFGPVGRGWEPRCRYAGTYDARWLDEHFPFLPPDFDEQYFQAAPADQQLALPARSIDVGFENLTPDGQRRFTVPAYEAPVHVFPRKGPREDYFATLDTIVFEPDTERFSLTWRVTRPLTNSLFEIGQVLVGRKEGRWWRERAGSNFPVPVVMVPTHQPASEPGE